MQPMPMFISNVTDHNIHNQMPMPNTMGKGNANCNNGDLFFFYHERWMIVNSISNIQSGAEF